MLPEVHRKYQNECSSRLGRVLPRLIFEAQFLITVPGRGCMAGS